MYQEHLGENYHNKIRQTLGVDETLLPDSIIDADLNIGGMRQLTASTVREMINQGNLIDSEKKLSQLHKAAMHYICGILCMALKSRTSAPPYDISKYQKKWNHKQKSFMHKGNVAMQKLIKM